jgi:hypothetical protein
MAGEPNTNSGGETGTSPLRGKVSTARDNLLDVGPYRVFNLKCPEKWDPVEKRLSVEYSVQDPNQRAVSGRIVYMVPGESGGRVVVHTQTLKPHQFKEGRHELKEGQRWDGTISEGLKERIGQKVMVDLNPIGVRVEIWNSMNIYSGKKGEFLSFDSDTVEIDAIVEARWGNHRCIPYKDLDEPELGVTKMIIRVRNVREKTPVRIRVARIADINYPGLDETYAETGRDAANQPGLNGAIVQGGRVVLSDGSEPYVRWNRYDHHWPHENENNFYCFSIAFGKRGDYIVASERDYENHEKKCLHMRFTVFIQVPCTDLKNSIKIGRSLHRFFRKETKYFRSYLKIGQFTKHSDWAKRLQDRYMIIILSHSSCACYHVDHPKKKDGSYKNVFRSGFKADQNVCPDDRKETAKFGGCGNRSGIQSYFLFGRYPKGTTPHKYAGKKVWLGNDTTWSKNKRLHLEIEGSDSGHIPRMNWVPRFLFHGGGCRTILTTNLGEYFVKSGTKFYAGWTYVSVDTPNGSICPKLFKRWIKGTSADRPAAENLTDRFVQAFAYAASRPSVRKYHPRLIDSSCTLVPPKKVEEVLL